MAYDRFLIAPLQTGLETDLPSWQTPEDSYASLNNAYVFRGRVRKRFGGTWMGTDQFSSRLGVLVDTTDGGGTSSGIVPGASGAVGQSFVIGTTMFTVQALGTPVTMLKTGSASTYTFNTTSGAFVFTGVPALTPVYWYPAKPVMGLAIYESGTINQHVAFAYDTKFVYKFAAGRWSREATALFHGNDRQFFWTGNWRGITADATAMFTSNFKVTLGTAAAAVTDDPIWWYNGTTWAPFSYSPDAAINPGNAQPYTVTRTTSAAGTTIASYIQSARIILPFKDRLVMLNTIENNANGAAAFAASITPANYLGSTNTQYVNRCRFSHNGSPFADNAWLEPNQRINKSGLQVADGGGFLDAATEEAIVGAEFIKDRLIVYFERSTWELVYIGNQVLPFVWQQINSGLGSQATFSTVQMDSQVYAVGNTGVHQCNGSQVSRLDAKIPEKVFQIGNTTESIDRIYGIRDFFLETVYWTFVPDTTDATYPTKVLVYNYKNDSWAFNDDSITCFGYFEQEDSPTWATSTTTWENSDFSWNSGIINANTRQTIAGNQQGYVWIVNSEVARNAAVLQVTNMSTASGVITLTIINHNLANDDFILVEYGEGITTLNNNIYQVTVIDANSITIIATTTGTYTGAAVATRVSKIDIVSKRWNPYIGEGRNFYLAKIDFGVMKTSDGAVTVDYAPSGTSLSMVQEGGTSGTNMLMGNNVLETSPYALVPLEAYSDLLWHPIYFQTDGQFVQINIILSDDQMRDRTIALSDFEIEGLILHTQRTGSRLQ